MKKVTVVGHIAMDYIFVIPYFPRKNHSIYIERSGVYLGGGGANIAVGIAKMGCRSELVATVPQKFYNSRYGKYLKESDIELSVTPFKGRMPEAYIFNDRENNQITYFNWGVSEHMGELRGEPREYVHIAPSHPTLALHMAKKGEFIAFEPGQDLPKWSGPMLASILKKINLLFCNTYELREIEKKAAMPKEKLIRHMDIVVTEGKKGSVMYAHSKKKRIPALPAKVVDPTGAGDAYKAAFWVGMMRGYDMETACKMGSIASSLVVEKMGGQMGVPTWDMLLKQYVQRFGHIENI